MSAFTRHLFLCLSSATISALAASAPVQDAAAALQVDDSNADGGRSNKVLMRRANHASPAGFRDSDVDTAASPEAHPDNTEPEYISGSAAWKPTERPIVSGDHEDIQFMIHQGMKDINKRNTTGDKNFGYFVVQNATGFEPKPFAKAEFGNSTTCEDSFITGISFHSGQEATCRELEYYCSHKHYGPSVKSRCPKTCGLCDLFVDAHEDDIYCMDAMPQDPPIFMLQGRQTPQDCRDLRMFCDTDSDVRWKCRSSCGVCVGNATNLEQKVAWTTTPWKIPTKDALTTSTTTIWSVPFEKDVQMTGCSRRRYMGFCATRRRGI